MKLQIMSHRQLQRETPVLDQMGPLDHEGVQTP